MIDPEQARIRALSDSTEDFFGFYELVWEFNTKYPSASEYERLEAARSALGRLFEEKLVEVFTAQASSGSPSYEPVAISQANAIIADSESYLSPEERPDGIYFAFAATPAGERAYQHLTPGSFAPR